MGNPHRVARQVDALQFAGGIDQEAFRVEERELTSYERTFEAALVVNAAEDLDILRTPLENGFGLRERRAALPAPHRARVAGRGGVSFAKRARDIEHVGVGPAGGAFRLRKD